VAIGVNWAEIWAPVWGAVWTQVPPEPPEPEPEVAQTPAGISRKRRLYVEIDGQQFPVESVAEATELLQRARALAEKQADERAVVATKKLKRKRVVPKVRIAAPVITVSPEIAVDVSPLIADIERLYRQAAETAELRLLLARQMREEDEDEAELLLLI
jgi:hypothetical protein